MLRAASAKSSYSYVTFASNTTAGTSFTFNSTSIGAESFSRVVVVGVVANGGTFSTGSISSVTIGGSAATQIVQSAFNNNFTRTALFYLPFSSGTTANIVVNTSQSAARCIITVYALYNLLSNTPTTNDSSPTASGNNNVNSITNTVNTSARSIVMSVTSVNTAVGDITFSANTTRDYSNIPAGSPRRFAAASTQIVTGGSMTITASQSSGTPATMQMTTVVFD